MMFGQYLHDADEALISYKKLRLTQSNGPLPQENYSDLEKLKFILDVIQISNAPIERTFSILEFIKSAKRNRIGLDLLNAVLTIKTHSQDAIFIPSKETLTIVMENRNEPSDQN